MSNGCWRNEWNAASQGQTVDHGGLRQPARRMWWLVVRAAFGSLRETACNQGRSRNQIGWQAPVLPNDCAPRDLDLLASRFLVRVSHAAAGIGTVDFQTVPATFPADYLPFISAFDSRPRLSTASSGLKGSSAQTKARRELAAAPRPQEAPHHVSLNWISRFADSSGDSKISFHNFTEHLRHIAAISARDAQKTVATDRHSMSNNR